MSAVKNAFHDEISGYCPECGSLCRCGAERYAEDSQPRGGHAEADGEPVAQVGPVEPPHAAEATVGHQSRQGARLSEALPADETGPQVASEDDEKARPLLECPECGGAGWVIGTDAECCGRSEYECGGRGCEGPFQVQVQDQCEFCGGNGNLPASADTRPQGGDSTEIEAPFTSGAVAKPDAQTMLSQTPIPSSRERK